MPKQKPHTEYCLRCESALATARADALRDAARIAKDARLGSGQDRRWKVASEIMDAIDALAAQPKGTTEAETL